MEWIPISQEPPKEIETDVYTNCVCGFVNGVVADAVYYHYEKKFYHNSDTSHSSPIPATHWFILKPPKTLNITHKNVKITGHEIK